MKNTKRIGRKRVFILPAILVLVGAAYLFLLPQLFQLPSVQEKTRSFLSSQSIGSISYERGRLAVFPKPCIHFYNVCLQSDKGYAGTIDEVSASLHLFSILRGRFNIAGISLKNAHCTMPLHEETTALSQKTVLQLLRQRLGTWPQMLGPVQQKKFTLDMENVTLSLTRAGQPVFSLRDMDGKFSWKHPVAALSLSIKTDLWDEGSLSFDMDVGTRSISGRIEAEHFTPTAACNYFFPDASLKLEDASMDADVSWKTDNFKTWYFSVGLQDPDVTFRKETSRLNVRGKRTSGEATIDSAGIHVAISELDLDSPEFRLNGDFKLDEKAPYAGWRINVENVDLASTRKAALFFADRFETTRIITQVLREGRVPQITIGQKAQTPKGLKKLASFYLDGQLDQATIFVPKAELLLTETSGRVTVTDGTLDATDLETRLGNSTGSRGLFTLELSRERQLDYRVACDLAADVAQLPPLLEKLVEDEAFSREMAGISSAEGSAEGAMVLNKTRDAFQIQVDVSKFDLSAAYDRIPFPVTLSGGGFHLQDREVRVENLRGDIGGSVFSDLTAALSWESALQLNISSGRAQVNTGDLDAWLGSIRSDLHADGSVDACSGHVVIDALQFDGPLTNPGEWRLQADGTVTECITVAAPFLSDPLKIYRCHFAATHEKIDILDADLSFQGAILAANGSLTNYLTGTPWMLDTLVVGRLDQPISDWLYKHGNIPEAFQWRTPLIVMPLALQWHEQEGIHISGQAAGENGLELAFDIGKTEDALTVHRLAIYNDGESAAGSLAWDGDAIEVSFSGDLTGSSLSALMADNRLLTGSLRGDFSARIDTAPPFLNSFTGRVQADRLDITPAGLPLSVEHLALSGTGAATEIESARFTWKDDTISSHGGIERIGRDLVLDLTVKGDDIDLASVSALMTTAQDTARDYAILGDIQFSCDRFNLNPELAFEPFQARLELEKDRIGAVFQDAEACGISFPGTLTLMPDNGRFSFQPSAAGQPLEPTVTCLRKGKVLMDGSYDLNSDLTFEWDRKTPLLEALGGNAALSAENGRIYKAVLLGKLFSLLNISDILSGQLPNLEKDGFPYKSATFSGQLVDGRFKLGSGVIDSSAMKIFFEGSEDFIHKEHDLTLVVAPLKTVDAVIGKIPVLNDVLEKGLVIYPIRVKGSWDDPQLSLLSPTAVGGEMLDLMGRTLKLPVTIFEKLLPGGDQ